jgi:hypothetical protein
MKWITRSRVKVDRVACPWLIARFIDKGAEFIFAPAEKVLELADAEGAIPFDTPGAELHHFFSEEGSERVTFDALVKKYGLTDPALLELANIVRGADAKLQPAPPESAGLEAAALGFRELAAEDAENLRLQFPLYDALYAYCKLKVEGRVGPTHALG